jgi:hypothetical protein
VPKKNSNRAPRAAERRKRLRELEAYLADRTSRDRKGYEAYERAHAAARAGKLSAAEAQARKNKYRLPHRRWWAAYEEARALRKQVQR